MINFYSLSFAAVIAVVGVGADYHSQSQKAGLPLGQLSFGTYLDSYSTRFAGMQEARAAKAAEEERAARVKAGARTYLPEAPEGWSRRAWLDGDNSPIVTPRVVDEFEREMRNENSFFEIQAKRYEAEAAERLNAQSWVYQRGQELVAIEASFKPAMNTDGLSGKAMKVIASNMTGTGRSEAWGVIQGVAFSQALPLSHNERPDYTKLNAAIGFGDEVRLSVRSNTTDAATREILAAIDYDGLNNLLPRPLSFVGWAAPEIAPEEEKHVAERMIEIRRELLKREGAAAMDWIQAASGPEDAMAIALREAGLDVTGNLGSYDATHAALLKQARSEAQIASQATVAAPEPKQAAPEEEAKIASPTKLATGFLGGGEQKQAKVAVTAPTTAPAAAPTQAAPTTRRVVSKPLSAEKIAKLQSLSGSQRATAQLGLQIAAKKFERKQGFPEHSCSFSMTSYRVECNVPLAGTTQGAAQEASETQAPRKASEVRRLTTGSIEDTGGAKVTCTTKGAFKSCKVGGG